ncbi:amidohydrolase, PncC family [Chitinasiproducens palmae]|uniref:Amidohydrolase, PncC family n=1 Tax=Chitinasiproducens palmae TaxID=1770053 RepID=A0A1H2PIT4_9BURK|nr:amidohydrolase, PncC family [Chitinasiproducens palmae]
MSEALDLRGLARFMTDNSLRLVTVESCTAGLMAALIGDLSGSGQWFEGALVTYSPDVKRDVAGVSHLTIERYGLTSEEVAREMAEGALSRTDAQIAVANTGLAEAPPDGEGPPAGTQCFAWAIRDSASGLPRVFSETTRFDGERNEIRHAAARYGLARIEQYHRRARSEAASATSTTSTTSASRETAAADAKQRAQQSRIIAELGVSREFDAAEEVAHRIDFLRDYLLKANQHAYVLGISGGVDSTTAGRLAQLACERARQQGHAARFYAVRLPYGAQADEADAQRALAFIRADEILTVNVKPASDAMLASLREAKVAFKDDAHADFVLGNI